MIESSTVYWYGTIGATSFYSQSTHLYKTKRPNMVACWFLCLLIPFSQAIARQRLEPDIVSRLGYALDGSMSLEPFHGC